MRVEVLGNTQDGGVPHLGCECDLCSKVRDDPERQMHVGSILLKENSDDDTVRYLIDATPDIRYQLRGKYIDGVFITHSELGHVTGLLYFGHEGPDASGLNVYGHDRVENFLMQNDPYRYLVDRGNIEVHNLEDNDDTPLQGGEIRARYFEHSLLNHPTTAYMIEGDERKLFYLSDIDEITEEIAELIEEAEIAVIDGTFWSEDEISRYEEVPHPTIKETIDRFEDSDTEIYFTHLNHTNPVLREDSEEREEMKDRGFDIAEKGDTFEI